MGIKNATAWVTFNLVVIFFMGCKTIICGGILTSAINEMFNFHTSFVFRGKLLNAFLALEEKWMNKYDLWCHILIDKCKPAMISITGKPIRDFIMQIRFTLWWKRDKRDIMFCTYVSHNLLWRGHCQLCDVCAVPLISGHNHHHTQNYLSEYQLNMNYNLGCVLATKFLVSSS